MCNPAESQRISFWLKAHKGNNYHSFKCEQIQTLAKPKTWPSSYPVPKYILKSLRYMKIWPLYHNNNKNCTFTLFPLLAYIHNIKRFPNRFSEVVAKRRLCRPVVVHLNKLSIENMVESTHKYQFLTHIRTFYNCFDMKTMTNVVTLSTLQND